MDKLKSVIGPTTIVEGLTDGSDWILYRHGFEEVTVGRVSEATFFSDYIKNDKFETMKVFERENISVTRPTLENISVTQPTLENISVTRPTFPISPSKNEFTISPSKNGKDQFTISPSKNGKEYFTISDPEPLTQPMKFPEEDRKWHVSDDPDPDPSLSDSSSKKKKRNKKKSCRKHRKDDSSDPSSSDDSDSSDDSGYRRKRLKRKRDR